MSQDRIERHHSEIRPKKVKMREIKNFRCGTKFFQLGGVVHNFLRKHQTFGCNPAEYSGVGDNISWNNIATVLETCVVID